MPNLSETFAFRVRLALDRTGKTKSDLARDLGESRQNIGGLISNPGTLKTVEKIASALGVPSWELLRPEGSADHPLEECLRRVVNAALTPPLDKSLEVLRAEGLSEDGIALVRASISHGKGEKVGKSKSQKVKDPR